MISVKSYASVLQTPNTANRDCAKGSIILDVSQIPKPGCLDGFSCQIASCHFSESHMQPTDLKGGRLPPHTLCFASCGRHKPSKRQCQPTTTTKPIVNKQNHSPRKLGPKSKHNAPELIGQSHQSLNRWLMEYFGIPPYILKSSKHMYKFGFAGLW